MDPLELQKRLRIALPLRRPSRAQVLQRQGEFLQASVSAALHQVPFYQRKFAGLEALAASVDSLERLAELPMTSRQELQQADVSSRLASSVRKEELFSHNTSGSSGRPLQVNFSHSEALLYQGFRGRVLAELRIAPTERMVSVILPSRDPKASAVFHPKGTQVQEVDCLLPPEVLAARLAELQPEVLIGFTGSIANAVLCAPPQLLAQIRPRVVVLLAEVVTPEVRSLLTERLSTTVREIYACTETAWIGAECAVTGHLHVMDENLVVEVVDDEGKPVNEGEEGEVLLTTLHASSQPFLRYAVGDRAIAGKPAGGAQGCKCGAPYSTLVKVAGRKNDALLLPGGRVVSAYHLTAPLLRTATFVARYQLVQKTERLIRWLIVPRRVPLESELEAVRVRAREVLGEEVRFEIEVTEALEQEPSGKFRIVKNELRSLFA